jgi:pyruvate dehydrogenase E1 component
VLLIKTVKGFGMGKAGEGKNTVHQTKKLTDDDIKYFRDRFNIPIPDSELPKLPFYKPADDTPEMKYLHERRQALGGYLPKRRAKADESFTVPSLDTFKAVMEPTAEGREISTTQAYVRFLTQLLRDQALGPRVVPILVDEARTFGMEGLFRQIGIYNPAGQQYTPVDKDQVMYYKEDKAGQILQEGINEAGGMSSWIAAATSYSTSNRIMVPFYVYYSMFGFQRIGDLAWAAGDMQARGFLLGWHLRAHHAQRRRPAARRRSQPHHGRHHPQLRVLRPDLCARSRRHHAPRLEAHGREARQRVLLHDPAQRKLRHAWPHARHRRADHQGHVFVQAWSRAKLRCRKRVQLLGLGHHLARIHCRQTLLEPNGALAADVWSCPSFNELTRDGQDAERWNLLHPMETRACPLWASSWPATAARWWRPPTT